MLGGFDMKFMLRYFLLGIFLSVCFLSVQASAYNIDGKVDDWGISLSSATGAGDLDNLTLTSSTANSTSEDNADDKSGFLQVYPGWSQGNLYDAEVLLFDNDGTYGYIALITGTHLGAEYSPGDIAIDINSATAALYDNSGYNGTAGGDLPPGEVPYEYAITLSQGNNAELVSVSSWYNVQYDYAPYNYSESAPWTVKETNVMPKDFYLDFAYSANAVNDHYVYEAAFLLNDLSLTDGDELGIKWTMKCGNDYLNLTADINTVPEPGQMILLGTGLIGLSSLRKKFLKN